MIKHGAAALPLLLALCAGSALHAQAAGSLSGTVRDAAGGAVSGAPVVAAHAELGVSYRTVTTSSGDYVFEALPIGTYSLSVTAPGFGESRIDSIEIHIATSIRQDVSLAVAGAATQVDVVSATPLVKTESAEIGQLVAARQISELPLNGRDIFSLLKLTAGSETGVTAAARFTTTERPALAGGRAGYTVFRLDGIDINSQNLPSASVVPSVGAVQEFRSITTLAPASESSSSSVNVALKSGSNEVHGSLFEFFRNDALDAHPFFQRRIVTPVFETRPDRLRYNQFGGGAGGPIRRNRAFYFGNVQVTRQRARSQSTGIYPTSGMLQGDFSGVNPLSGAAMRNFTSIVDPESGAPFPGGRIPGSRFSDFAQRFLPIAFLPANCLSCQAQGLGFNFVGSQPGRTSGEQYIARIDYRLAEADTLSGTLQVDRSISISTPSPIPIGVMELPVNAYFGSLREVHSFGPNLLNEARAGYVRNRATQQQQQDAQGAFSFRNTPTSLPSLFPTVAFAGYPTRFGNGLISNRNFGLDESLDASDRFSWSHGRHLATGGFEIIRAHFWNTVNLNAFFVYADNLSPALGFTGSGFADFLIGVPFQGVTFQGTGKADMVERSVYAGYLQDTWRVSERVTLNLGLRYEFAQRWHDRDTSRNRLGTLDIGPESRALGGRFLLGGSASYYLPGVGVVAGSGAPLIRGSLVDPAWRDFQPRIGLAWRPFRDNRTAIRAGFGVYFTLQDANSLAFEMLSPPFSFQSSVVNLPPAAPAGRPLHDFEFWPATPPAGVATEGNNPRNRDPRLYQWTFSLERQVAARLLLSAEYLGNHGVKNPLTTLPNAPALPDAKQLATLLANPSLNVSLATARAPFPRVSLGYQYIENAAPSWYQALNLRAEGRVGNNLTVSAVYTRSKALDLESAEQQLPGIAGNVGLGKSYSDYDHPNRFVASWVYELPRADRFRNRLASAVLGGWESVGIATFESGPPFSVTVGADTSLSGAAAPVYPNMIGPPVPADIRATGGIYLTPANFVVPPFGQYGQLARNSFHGPGVNNFDLGFFRIVRLGRAAVQLRGELFNAFNHAQFAFTGSSLASSLVAPAAGAAAPTVVHVDSSLFGRASTRSARIAQLGFRLSW